MRDENDTTTADLLRTVTTELESDKAGRSEFTIAGFGTGTVAELEAHLAQITDERDALQKEAQSPTTNAALNLYDAVSFAAHTSAGELLDQVAQLTADLRTVKSDLESMRRELGDIDTAAEIDGDVIWAEIEYRVREVAEESASEAAGEIDGGAIWAEIEDRVTDTAAESARSVIRDELVVNADLI
jgi:hypothetical protein